MAAASTPRPASEQHAWPSPEVLREHAPIFRLLAVIEAVPEVAKIGVTNGRVGVTLWVFMDRENDEGESAMYGAERAYLTATSFAPFELRIVPNGSVAESDLPPYDLLFER